MNTMRVFLHNLLWEQDPKGFQQRIDAFLTIAARHHIRPVFVLFDSCWDADPQARPAASAHPRRAQLRLGAGPGRRDARRPRAVSAPGELRQGRRRRLRQRPAHPGLGPVERARQRQRQTPTPRASPATRTRSSSSLLPQVFAWARIRAPHAAAHQRRLARRLDLARHHAARWPASRSSSPTSSPSTTTAGPRNSSSTSQQLEQFHRPILCTEYMARGAGSTFDTVLPIAQQYHVGAINWGLVARQEPDQPALGLLAAPLRRPASPRSGSTTSSIPTARPTASAKWTSSAR